MKSTLQLLQVYFVLFFALGAGLYFLATSLGALTACGFSSFEGSSNFHCQFPYQYIAVFAASAAIVIALWVQYFYNTRWQKRYLTLLAAFILIIPLSSILGGVLWATHSILIEQSWRGMNPFQYYLFMIGRSLQYGWIAIARSFPLNILLLGLGGLLISYATPSIKKLLKYHG